MAAAPLVTAFSQPNYFLTYKHERNASISTNCNVLMALLKERPICHTGEIVKIVRYLCERWWTSGRSVADKWVSEISYLLATY
jgi:hypothetical protein